MSDPKYGEPVEESTPATEPTSADAAVASANDSLAEAEAASRDAVTPEKQAAAAETTPATHAETPRAADADARDAAPEAHASEHASAADAAAETPGSEPDATPADAADAPVTRAADAADADASATRAYDTADADASATRAYDTSVAAAPAVTASEPAATPAPVAPAYAAPQPIFVQAPEPPRARGNRGAAGAIGLLATVSFGVLYLAAALGLGLVEGDYAVADLGTQALSALTSWWFWTPVVVFFVGFWILGAIVNRGRWGYWVIFGLLVGVVSYGGHLLGQLMQAPFWSLTARQGADLIVDQSLAPLAIAAFIFGRELTIWFGAWVAARGKRVTELNYEAQREYERTLEAGPQLHQM